MRRLPFRLLLWRHVTVDGRRLAARALRARFRPVTVTAAATALAVLVSVVPAGVSVVPVGPLSEHRREGRRVPPNAGAKIGELPERSTLTSTTRHNKDSSYTTTVYSAPVNYRAADSTMRRIDSRLYPTNEGGYAWRSGANAYEVRFKDVLEAGFTELRVGGSVIRTSAVGASTPRANVNGSQVSYPGAFPGADLTYTVSATGVKEAVKLAGPDSPASYTFRMSTVDGKGLTAQRRADGSYLVAAASLPEPLVLDAPVVQESAGGGELAPPAAKAKPRLRVGRQGRELLVTLSLDRAWLRAPERRFPVHLDPTITIQPNIENATWRTVPNTLPLYGTALYIGTDTQNVYRSAVQFDLSAVPTGAQVSTAQFELYYPGHCINTYCSVDHPMDVHRMTSAWTRSSTYDQLTYDATVSGSYTLAWNAPAGWMSWPVTGLVSGWVNGTQPNYGLLVKRHTEPLSSNNAPVASGRTGVDPPKITVTYTISGPYLQAPTTVRSNGADLAWTPSATGSGSAGYEVHRGTTPGFTPDPTTLLATIGDRSVRGYRDTTASANGTFTYRVKDLADGTVSVPRTVTLPAAGLAITQLQPGPAEGRATHLKAFTDGTTPPPGEGTCWNFGARPTVRVGSDRDWTDRAVLYFDLGDIPQGATISSATMSLWRWERSLSFGESMTVQAHRITRPWKEGTGTSLGWPTCTGDGASWLETEAGQPWSTPGGDFDPTPAASVPVPPGSGGGSDGVVRDDFAVTGLVQSWVSQAIPNHGVMLRTDRETTPQFNWLDYASDDFGGGPAMRPKLTVSYRDGNAALGPQVSLAAPGPNGVVSGSAVRLAASAQDDRRVDQVEFLVDGLVVGVDNAAPFEVSWNSTVVGNGARSVRVRAVDDAGNVTTSAPVSITVDNTAPPSGAVSAPANNATVSGTVTVSATASDDVGVASVAFLVDGVRIGAPDTTAPYTLTWNTLAPLAPSFNGSHQLTVAVTDTSGQTTVSAARTVTVANLGGTTYSAGFTLNAGTPAEDVFPAAMVENTRAGVPVQDPYAGTTNPDGTSGGSLNRSLGSAPQNDGGTPPATCPADAYCPTVRVRNTSGSTWQNSRAQVWYRWYAPNGAIMFEGKSSGVFPASFGNNATQDFPLTIYPPALPPGATQGTYRLRIDVYDRATGTWFAARGNPPTLDNPIIIAKSLATKLGLERYYQYDGGSLGAGASNLVNVANGNLLVRWSPFFAPGRGLATMTDLTYNSLEDHSTSPAGNNFSLSISGLTRLGEPLDIHPNKADEISGRSNKWVEFTDGDGTTHRFTDGVTGGDGITRFTEPPGVNLYLRSVPTNPDTRRWALTRPDKVTFFFDVDGFPTMVEDRNGNRITYTLQDTPAGEDPGGPKKRITAVTDAGGRSFTIAYWSKDEAKKAHVRGKFKRIADHTGSALDFHYYDDGNLLRLTQRGGTNAGGTFLADRSLVFTYTTSDGAGPAIPTAADRVDPDPKTANQSTRLYSVRDPRGAETSYAYMLATDGQQLRWKLKSRTDRDGQTTRYGYDPTTRVTTVTKPDIPRTRVTSYIYDTTGKVTQIVNPNDESTQVEWSSDFKVTKVTEPTTRFTTYEYNSNGYLTSQINQTRNETTRLTYFDSSVDPGDTGNHLSLLSTVTTPKGVATTTVPDDYRWTFSYDSAGNPDLVTDPTGAQTDYDYNLAGSANPGTLAAIQDANGNAATTFPAYDPSGQPTQIRDPLGNLTRIGYDADGLVRSIQDPNHANDSGTDQRAYKSFFDYDSFHRLGRQSAPKSTSAERGTLLWSGVEFDANDNVVSSMDPHFGPVTGDPGTDAVTTAAYDATDRRTLVTGPDTSADSAGERTRIDYDAAGRISKITKPKGVASGITDDYATVYGYDLLDRAVTRTRYGTSTSQVRVTQMCYDLAGDLRSVTSPRAGTATITCPGNGPADAPYTVEYDYDAAHRRTVQRDELGHTRRIEYDKNGNVTAGEADISAGRSARTDTDYNQRDEPVTLRQRFDGAASRDLTTVVEYDNNGNLSKVISPRAYDAANGGTPTYYVTVNSYDALNRPTRVALPFDARDGTERQYVHHAYDANGNLVSTSLPVTSANPANVAATAKTQLTYLDPGWIRTSDDPANPTVHFDYSAQGWQAKRQAEQRGTPGSLDDNDRMFWDYYLDGQLRSRTDRGGQISRYEYDPNNNLVKAFENGLSDPGERELQTQATPTGFDEVAKVRHRKADATVWTFTDYDYDGNGNVTLRRENGEENDDGTQTKAPRRVELTYDGADWLTQQLDLGTDGACKDDSRTVTAWWDTGWEKQRDTYRAGATCTADSSTWPKIQTTTWTHFDNGKLRTLLTRNGAGTTTESHDVGYFDAAGDYVNGNRTSDRYVLRRAEGSSATTCLAAAPCDARYTYDARDRLLTHQLRAGRTDTYTLDEPAKLLGDSSVRAGNITTQVRNGVTTSMRYTGGQLTDITVGGVTGKYWYDSWGNLDCLTLAAGTQTDCSPAEGAPVSANLITDHSYDYLNRLTSLRQYSSALLTDKTTYTYDALDRTSKEVEDHTGTGTDRTTEFTYQGLSWLATEEKQTGGANPRTKTYSYDAYGHRVAMTDKATASTAEPDTYTYGTDVHSSISQLIDSAGRVKASYGYDAYGGTDAPSTDPQALTTGDPDNLSPINPYRYSGKRLDPGTTSTGTTPSPVPNGSGGYDMGARRYGPDTTRFLQQDMYAGALADLGLTLDPLTQNRYALAAGNPISYIETDGHMLRADGGGGGWYADPTLGHLRSSTLPSLEDKSVVVRAGKGFVDTLGEDVKQTKETFEDLEECGYHGGEAACKRLREQAKQTGQAIGACARGHCAAIAESAGCDPNAGVPECAGGLTATVAEMVLGGGIGRRTVDGPRTGHAGPGDRAAPDPPKSADEFVPLFPGHRSRPKSSLEGWRPDYDLDVKWPLGQRHPEQLRAETEQIHSEAGKPWDPDLYDPKNPWQQTKAGSASQAIRLIYPVLKWMAAN